MLTAACQWHPGATARSASTTCTCAAPVAWTIEPRNHAGPQHCTHSPVTLVNIPISDGMVPVNEFWGNHLEHIIRHRQQQAQPEAQSERYARAEGPLAAAHGLMLGAACHSGIPVAYKAL